MTILPNKKKQQQENQQKSDAHHHHHQRYSYSDGGPSTSRQIYRDRDEIAGTSGPPTRRQRLGAGGIVNRLSPSHTASASRKSGGSSRKGLAPSQRDLEGYNSEDEYDSSQPGADSQSFAEENERKFEEVMKKHKGFFVHKMEEDGACLFRAVADQIYGDQEMHGTVRDMCMDYMFVTEDFKEYVTRKRRDTEHGNHVEIQAMAEVFNRPTEIYQSYPISLEPINTFQARENSTNPPILLSYHGGCHYNSLRDPYAPTVGVGLGLPQFFPGLADRNLLRDAAGASQTEDIEKTMLEDKLRVTDVEATEEQMSEQVARESYLQFMRSREQEEPLANRPCHSGSSDVSKPAGTPSSAHHSPKAQAQASPKSNSGSKPNSPSSGKLTKTSAKIDDQEGAAGGVTLETASLMNEIPLTAFGMADDLDADLMTQMMAISQQEYWDSLKKSQMDKENADSSDKSKTEDT